MSQDIFYLVFKELRKDVETLHSCILANRLCCELAIPILWRNPWRPFQADIEVRDPMNTKSPQSLFNVLASFLPPVSKNLLLNIGINLTTNITQIHLIYYVEFITKLDYKALSNVINESVMIEKPYYRAILKQEILKMIITRSPGIKTLFLKRSSFIPFNYFSGATECLKNLTTVKYNFALPVVPDFLFLIGLAQICHNIKKINISGRIKGNEDIGLTTLIEVQRNLKFFSSKIRGNIYKDENSRIAAALKSKAQSIISLVMHKDPIHPSILTKFCNLQMLELGRIGNYNLLDDIVLLKLKYLRTRDISVDNVIKIIQSTGGELIEAGILGDYTEEEAALYHQALMRYGPNLEVATFFCNEYNYLNMTTEIYSTYSHIKKGFVYVNGQLYILRS